MSPIFEAIPEKAKSVKRTAQAATEPLQVIPEEEELIIITKSNTGTSRQQLCSACPPSAHLSPSRTHA
jgi:hypothetical protein